jgi:hypothetical protein
MRLSEFSAIELSRVESLTPKPHTVRVVIDQIAGFFECERDVLAGVARGT